MVRLKTIGKIILVIGIIIVLLGILTALTCLMIPSKGLGSLIATAFFIMLTIYLAPPVIIIGLLIYLIGRFREKNIEPIRPGRNSVKNIGATGIIWK